MIVNQLRKINFSNGLVNFISFDLRKTKLSTHAKQNLKKTNARLEKIILTRVLLINSLTDSRHHVN